MSTILDETDRRLAEKLKSLREFRGWSLSDLAGRSGVSRAMIHKVETYSSSPTASLLGRLSGAFGLTISQLLAQAEGATSQVVRSDDRPFWVDAETGFRRKSLSPISPMRRLEIVSAELPPGRHVAYPASAYTFIEQQVLVLTGKLTLVEGDMRHVLAAGDCLALGPPSDCDFRNEGAALCSYLVALARLNV